MIAPILAPLSLLLLPGAAPEDPPVASEDAPTFIEVAPIIYRRCTPCHRPGAAGPFPLITYRDVSKRGAMISWAIEDELMPPWHPVEGHGEFKGSLALQAGERATLLAWLAGAMPAGDPGAVPEPPAFTDGWQLGTPDLVVAMDQAFEVPASGADIYRNFAVEIPGAKDRWLTAIEVRAGAPRVLHHVVFDIDTRGRGVKLSGRDGRPGWDAMTGAGGGAAGWNDGGPLLNTSLGGWAVGSQPRKLPMGLARRLPAGAHLILRSHFHPSGKRESELTTLGLHFSDTPPAKELMGLQMPPMFGTAAGIEIPAGEARFVVRDSFTLPVDALALTVGGHAHSLLEEMRVTAAVPGSDARSLFWIDAWDFDWQNRYEWQTPIELPKGTEIEVELIWNNSVDNPDNPFDPPQPIRWGFQSTDEMGSVTIAMVARDEADAPTLWKAMRKYKGARLSRSGRKSRRNERQQAWRMQMGDRVRQLDANGDGELAKSELKGGSPDLVKYADRNGDGDLDRGELVAILGEAFLPDVPGAQEAFCYEDLDGREHDLMEPGEGALAHVLVFTTVDCPIANGYSPSIAALIAEHVTHDVRFFHVHVDPDVTPAIARSHADEYGLMAPVVLDGSQRLAVRLGITHTPEVAVIGRDGAVLYRGRIDDQYKAVGRRRPAPTTEDLSDALRALVAGKAVPNPETEAVGCLLPKARGD